MEESQTETFSGEKKLISEHPPSCFLERLHASGNADILQLCFINSLKLFEGKRAASLISGHDGLPVLCPLRCRCSADVVDSEWDFFLKEKKAPEDDTGSEDWVAVIYWSQSGSERNWHLGDLGRGIKSPRTESNTYFPLWTVSFSESWNKRLIYTLLDLLSQPGTELTWLGFRANSWFVHMPAGSIISPANDWVLNLQLSGRPHTATSIYGPY